MIFIVFIVCLISILEIGSMKKNKNNRGIVIFIILAAITLAMGACYFSKSPEDSFANLFFRMVKISY